MESEWKCSSEKCRGSFKLDPRPPDRRYYIPKRNPESQDNFPMTYDCDLGHPNIIYWHKAPTLMASVGKEGVDVMQT